MMSGGWAGVCSYTGFCEYGFGDGDVEGWVRVLQGERELKHAEIWLER